MGPRPVDFDEALVRKAPTFHKWMKLHPGETLSYACRQFVKGGEEDEERLMRRIMIARRNNLKDHATLKEARATEAQKRGVIPGLCVGKKKGENSKKLLEDVKVEESLEEGNQLDVVGVCPEPSNPSGTKRRRIAGTLQPSDEEILMEMDVPAVEATRSYRKWRALPEGSSFTYNQKYIKGKDDHDWLLKKNIWRRMRYRRENQNKVIEMKNEPAGVGGSSNHWPTWKVEMPNDATVNADADLTAKEEEEALVSKAVVDAAAAAAAQVEPFEPGIDADAVAALGGNDPIVASALDAAAQLARAAVADVELEENVVGDIDVEQVEVMISV